MWVKNLFPRTVLKTGSAYNRDIRVVLENSAYKLLANGSRQSGTYVEKLWRHAFNAFEINEKQHIQSILVLGVAGGDVIHMVREIYPDAKITGVDIDEKMIDIGKKYFNLNKITHLTLVVADAKEFVKRKHKWDLVLVDTHVGASVPAFVAEEQFLLDIKKIMNKQGKLVINYLQEFEYEKLSELLLKKLQNIFPTVTETNIFFNRFFLCLC